MAQNEKSEENNTDRYQSNVSGSIPSARKRHLKDTAQKRLVNEDAQDDLGREDWISQISEKAESFDKKIEAFVRNRPLVAMLGAVAIGYAVNQILNHREGKMS